jgi:hypothetical protein
MNGETMTGELLASSGNDLGVQIKVGDGKYERVPWASFSQEDLKKFKQVKKLEPFVEPFIEVTQEERNQKTEVNIKPPPRLERPPHKSLIAAMFSSGLGFVMVLIFFAASSYAGYEVAVFRAQPRVLVCGISAILPVLGPILFLALPTRTKPVEATWETAEQAEASAAVVNPMLDAGTQHPTGMRLARGGAEGAGAAPGNLPQTTTFQRGQFTFNRRFFETKFPNFFGVIKREAEKDMVLLFKCGRAEYIAERITRIAANDLHVHLTKGDEVSVSFQEIQEVRLKHRNAP